MFTKMSEKKRINQFGEQSVAAMFKEYRKLNDVPMPRKPFFGPINNEEFISEDSNKALEVMNLI